MVDYSYKLVGPIGHRATLGLIVLQSDETIEAEMRQMLPADGVAMYVSRVPSGAEVTRESLAQMGPELTGAAGLLPPSLAFDAVGYGCTSGTSVIGADAVAKSVRAGCTAGAVTEPLTALTEACRALGVRRLAFLSPYIAEVSAGLRGAMATNGITCTALGTFNEAEEAKVARIEPASIADAARDLAKAADAEAVFISCTNLRTLDIVGALERETDLPILSSNQVLGWHLGRLAGISANIPGRLARV